MCKPNILFITDALTEPLYGRRTRFFCSYFHSRGYRVRLITERYKPLPFTEEYEIMEIPYYRSKGKWQKAEWAIKNMLSVVYDYRNRYFAKAICEAEKDEKPNMVICSTFYTMGLRAADTLARKYNIPFVADLRDIVEQCATNQYERPSNTHNPIVRTALNLYRKVNIIRRDRILCRASALTAVSPWTVNFLKGINPSTHLIYNGYDSDIFRFEERKCNRFRITYMGKWYGDDMQDPTPLFEAIEKIKDSRPDVYADIDFEWYTSTESHRRVTDYAQRHNVTESIKLNPYIPFADVPDTLHKSSIILILTSAISAHVLPTKLFEAIGVEKPVLCVRCTPGALAETIKETNAGLATTSTDEVYNYILQKHAEWQHHGYTRQLITHQSTYYSRQNQAQQLEKIVSELTNRGAIK